MSFAEKQLLTTLDQTCLKCFSGALAAVPPGFTVSLVTLAEDGWPVTALLGPGELYAANGSCVTLALWPTSRANQNLLRTGRGSLDFVADGRFYQLRLNLLVSQSEVGLMLHHTAFSNGEAQSVPYARLTTGIQYELTDPQPSWARWQRQIDALRTFAHSVPISL